MFRKNDTVLYKNRGICNIEDIVEMKFEKERKKYYKLVSLGDGRTVFFVPTDNKELTSKMFQMLKEDEIKEMIGNVENLASVWEENETRRKEKFQNIIKNGNRKEIFALIKTIYEKREELKSQGKKLHAEDAYLFKEGEKILYEEFAHVLNIEKDRVTDYIAEEIKNKLKLTRF